MKRKRKSSGTTRTAFDSFGGPGNFPWYPFLMLSPTPPELLEAIWTNHCSMKLVNSSPAQMHIASAPGSTAMKYLHLILNAGGDQRYFSVSSSWRIDFGKPKGR